MPSVMHMPSDETEQYDCPKTTVQRDDSSGEGDEGGDGGGDWSGGEGGGGCGGVGGECGGDGGGGWSGGEGGGENKTQIVKPAPLMLESLAQVTSVPAATCTFIGPVVPEYAAFPILMKS